MLKPVTRILGESVELFDVTNNELRLEEAMQRMKERRTIESPDASESSFKLSEGHITVLALL